MLKLQITVLEENKILGVQEIELNPPSQPEEEPEEKMTDAQRRYLFRLLSEMGIEGERARDTIKEQISTKEQRPILDVKEVTKTQASWLIEKLKSQLEKWRGNQNEKEGGSHGTSK